jgi:hypothetical protein
MAKIGTEIKAMMQNTQSTDFRLCSFDFPSQELIFAATYNSAEYCRFENIDPDPLATEAGRFVLLGNSANATDAHSKLAKQFSITRGDSKTLGLSCLPNSSQAFSQSRGWVDGISLQEGELVLGYNSRSNSLEYTPVQKVHSLKNQEVWAAKNTNRTLLSTKDHRWVTSPRKDSVKGFDYSNISFQTTANLQDSRDKILHAAALKNSPKSLLTPNEARILTWLLTDGSWAYTYDKRCPGYRGLRGSITQGKQPYVNQILKLLKEENALSGEPYQHKKVTNLVCYSFYIKPEYLKALLVKCGQGGIDKKHFDFSSVVRQLNLKALRASAFVMLKAEGTLTCKGLRIAQNDGPFSDDIATVFFMAGFKIKRNKKYTNAAGNTVCNISVSPLRYSQATYDKCYLHSIEDVWCITTPLSTFVTRQADGFITITGNCLYSAGITSCCNLLRPTLGLKYNDKELKTLVTDYIRHFKGTKARGDYLYQGGLFSHFFNYISWLISQPVPRLQFGGQAITNTLRPEWCGNDYFTSRANWPVQGMGAYLLDCMGYEIDKQVFEAGLEDFIWYQFSCHDQLSYMCHESAVAEWASITRKAYKTVWSNFFKSFRMTCPQEVFDNLELTSDVVDRKSVDTNLCTASGKSYFTGLPNGLIV